MARKRSSPKALVTCSSCGCEVDPSSGAVNFCPACGADLRAKPADLSRSGGFVHRVIADRYRLVALVGEGGMGAVYRAEHIRMGKVLALKILRGDFAREPGAADRFLSEARIVSRLSHPHTIAVFDFGEIDAAGSGFYLAMEYVPGKDLATVLRESGPLPERRAAGIAQQMLGSLAEAHDAGVVHRDMKPGNVMLMQTRSGEDYVKVLDFGIAKLRHAPADGPGAAAQLASASTTSAGAILGTPSYLAPEQARGEGVDHRADLYAVGCLLHELVSGKPPFVAPSPVAVVAAHLHELPRPLASVVPGVSRGLSEVVARALAKKPEERFQTADAMRDALAEVSEPTRSRALAGRPETGAPGMARREDFADFERQVRALRRWRVLAPALALGAVAAAAGVAWRWTDVAVLLATRAPSLAAALPEALRAPAKIEGEEREPNDLPARANPLSFPPGADGRPGSGVAEVRGSVGARLSDAAGDVDVFRLEVPPEARGKVLVAEWTAERGGEGIRGLDVALSLNREPPPGDARVTAPLVRHVNRGGPGRPERLAAAVEPGVHYLSVRETHDDATGPVEKPTDRYVLTVRFEDPRPGEELEPNDGPERGAADAPYSAWRGAAERNPLGEAAPLRAETGPGDPDLFAVSPRREEEVIELVVAAPDPALALAARLWRPDPAAVERAGVEDAGAAAAGEVLVVPVRPGPRPGAPVVLELRAAEGEGRYAVVALGPGAASVEVAGALVRELAGTGRTAAAASVARALALAFPGSAGVGGVLVAAGLPDPSAVATVDPAAASTTTAK